jgi:hypothetical protein
MCEMVRQDDIVSLPEHNQDREAEMLSRIKELACFFSEDMIVSIISPSLQIYFAGVAHGRERAETAIANCRAWRGKIFADNTPDIEKDPLHTLTK